MTTSELENLGFDFKAIKEGNERNLKVSVNIDDTGAGVVEVATAGQGGGIEHHQPLGTEFNESVAMQLLRTLGYVNIELVQ